MVPIQIIKTLYLKNRITDSIDKLGQPINSITRMGITITAGLIVFQLIQLLFEGLGSTPTPFSIIYALNNLILTIWLVIVMDGWPFKFIKNRLVSAMLLLVVSMTLSYVMFGYLYDFSEFSVAPFYNEMLNPQGLYPASVMLAFMVTVLAVVLAFVLFDLFDSARKSQTPTITKFSLGIFVLIISYGLFFYGIHIIGDPVKYLVNTATSVIFGEFIVILISRTNLFKTITHPLKGTVYLSIAILIAIVCNILYTTVALRLFPNLPSGAPTYGLEIWNASAMLAVTFTAFVLFSQLLQFWPLNVKED